MFNSKHNAYEDSYRPGRLRISRRARNHKNGEINAVAFQTNADLFLILFVMALGGLVTAASTVPSQRVEIKAVEMSEADAKKGRPLFIEIITDNSFAYNGNIHNYDSLRNIIKGQISAGEIKEGQKWIIDPKDNVSTGAYRQLVSWLSSKDQGGKVLGMKAR